VSEADQIAKIKAREQGKSTPSAGVFGFAGTTLFQPGQRKFAPESAAQPKKPDAADDAHVLNNAD
jgi:hypothetical protein